MRNLICLFLLAGCGEDVARVEADSNAELPDDMAVVHHKMDPQRGRHPDLRGLDE